MVEILPGLLLGGMSDVQYLLRRKSTVKLTHLLSVVKEALDWSDLHSPSPGPISCKLIQAIDLPSTDLLIHFPEATDFIQETMDTDGTILVHCEYGLSRSATIVIAYFIKYHKMSFNEAIDFVKEKKPDIRPNAGFISQLKLWYKMKGTLNETDKSYKSYRLSHQAKAMKDNGYMKSMEMTPDPINRDKGRSCYYTCRKCRRVLFDDESVLQHELGEGFDDYKYKEPVLKPAHYERQEKEIAATDEAVARLGQEVSQITLEGRSHDGHMISCSSLFIEPVEWMGPLIIGRKDGKLSCPKCCSRIGSFDWSGGQCSCGRWVTPSFQIHKSKIDFKIKLTETPPTATPTTKSLH